MGSSQSTTTVTELSQTITNIAESVVQNCQVASTQTQNAVINNTGFSIFGNYTTSQATTISDTCFQDTSLQTQLQNQILNAIQQATTSDGSSIMPAFGNTSSSANTNLTNIVKNAVTMKNIQNNYTQIQQSQNVTINNSGVQLVTNLDMSQGSQIFAAATLKALDDAGVFTAIKNQVDQQSSASNSLFSLSGLLSGLGQYIYVIAAIFIGIIGYNLYKSQAGKSQKDAQAPTGKPAAAANS
jgi:hypothetical protein